MATKPQLTTLGVKILPEHWEAVRATAEAKGVDVATYTRSALESAVKKDGLFIFPPADPAAYKRGRPCSAVDAEPKPKKKRAKKSA
jgi:hypothetical protein